MVASVVQELRLYQRAKYTLRPVRAIVNLVNRSLKPHFKFSEEERTEASKELKDMSSMWEPSGSVASPTASSL